MKIRNSVTQTGKILKKPAMWLLCVILCVALAASFTLAWYVSTAEISDNRLISSTFAMTVKIENGESQVTLTEKEDGSQEASLTAGTYIVTLGCTNRTNGHGSCIVTVNGQSQQTEVFGMCGITNCDKCAGRETVQFTLVVPEGEIHTINLMPRWGSAVVAAN